jgi:hypothetical protein
MQAYFPDFLAAEIFDVGSLSEWGRMQEVISEITDDSR